MRIGPTFPAELRAAGVPLEGYSWGEDGVVEFREDIPPEVRDQVAAVLAAHDPTAPAPTRFRAELDLPITRALIAQIAAIRGVSVDVVVEEAVAHAEAASAAPEAGEATSKP